MRSNKFLIGLVLLSLFLSLGIWIKTQKQNNQVLETLQDLNLSLENFALQLPSENESTLEQDHVVIFLVKATPNEFYLVPINRQVGGPVHPRLALQTLLAGPLAFEELFASVPHTTKLLGLSIHDGLAVANFSEEIVTDFNGGSLLESYLVESIVNTLTEFPEIDRVQILVEGETIESLGGHVLITGPLKRAD